MAIAKLDDWLAPWEKDKDGKKLDEPTEIDAGRIKKYLHGLLSDKEKLQEDKEGAESDLAQVKEQLTTVQRENETKEQTAERQRKEQEKLLSDAQALIAGQKKLDVALSIPGITAERARVLARRINGDDEKALKADAEELVAEGFRIAPVQEKADDGGDGGDDDDLSIRPHQVRRTDGTPVKETGREKKTDAQIINEAIPIKGW